ncbi:MAG: hypothetical protein CMK56_06305 [Proteobacteria bacterium]|nr:hypothetical protein [Pseudomonadota bacterium]
MESHQYKRLKPNALISLVAVLGLFLTLLAANWQYDRALYKQGLLEKYNLNSTLPVLDLINSDIFTFDDSRYRRVLVRGRFLRDEVIFVDNKIVNGVVGYDTIVPLKISQNATGSADGQIILVNRGWMAWGSSRIPNVNRTIPTEIVPIVGKLDFLKDEVFLLSDIIVEKKLWPAIYVGAVKEKFGENVKKLIIYEENLQAEMANSFRTPEFGIDTHYMYMGQWLLFACLIVVLYFYFMVWERKKIGKKEK